MPVKKSVFPDHIVCLEDGKKLKMLKRHLKTAYNMTPEQYRERWGLTADYPMVAPELRQAPLVAGQEDRAGHQAARAPLARPTLRPPVGLADRAVMSAAERDPGHVRNRAKWTFGR